MIVASVFHSSDANEPASPASSPAICRSTATSSITTTVETASSLIRPRLPFDICSSNLYLCFSCHVGFFFFIKFFL